MDDAAARYQEVVRLVQGGRLQEAEAACIELAEVAALNAPVAFLRGLIAFQQNDVASAVERIAAAAGAAPDNPGYHATLGAILLEHGDPADARAALERAVALNPDDTASRRNIAQLHRRIGQVGEAIAAFERLDSDGMAEAEDLLALGALLQATRGPDAAVSVFERAVAEAPGDVLARNHLAACQQLRGHIGEAMDAYRASIALQARDNPATVGLFAAKQTVCDWRGFEEVAAQVDAMTAAAVAAGRSPVEDPFLNVSRCMNPRRNYDVARLWSEDLSRKVAAWGVRFEHPPRERERLRIGYLSSDFHDHATAHLMRGLFAAHDRRQFAVRAYSCGADDGSAYRQHIAANCDAFVDLSGVETIAAAQRIHGDGIDILVDLKGYTRRNRLDIAALRPAPIQVAWLGFPGTSGADFFDYVVTDDIVTPAEATDAYSEAFAVMPNSYQVNDRDQAIAEKPFSRSEAGLPTNAFVFASFNNTYKLEPVMFAAWMKLLRDLPNAVLWLLPNNAAAVDNLRREAEFAGVAADRLIFADMMAKPDHLRRAALADLALDTRVYNGHTTTSDMLWAGVPVVTLKGNHFASRVSASLLTAFGLPELVTESIGEYKALAGELAGSAEKLNALRGRVGRLRLQCPLFDTARFARNFERACLEMWRRYRAGGAVRRLPVDTL